MCRQHVDVSGASGASGVSGSTNTQRVRWERSTWHRVLLLLDEQLAGERALLAGLLGAERTDIEPWIRGAQAMPPFVQWQMAVVAEHLARPESTCARLSRTLRAELEARAAYLRRGALRDEAPPYDLQIHGSSHR